MWQHGVCPKETEVSHRVAAWGYVLRKPKVVVSDKWGAPE